MSEIFEKLSLLFDKIKGISIWDRILPWRWGAIVTLSYEAYSQYCKMLENISTKNIDAEQARTRIATLLQENEQLRLKDVSAEKDLTLLKSTLNGENKLVSELKGTISTQAEAIRQLEKALSTKQNEIALNNEKLNTLTHSTTSLKEEIASLKKSEANALKLYEEKIATLDQTQKRLERERNQEIEARHNEEISRMAKLKEKWSKHQDAVKESVKAICNKHTIEYVDKPSIKGEPDNTIRLCDEYVIFDAKCPASDDLNNFPKYINAQVTTIKKYADQENIKREIFLVVPANTVHVLDRFSHNVGSYKVYIVTIESLEPIILCLKKIEEYEFAKELSPEERENICEVIGQFSHTAKRRIQIDQYFARLFLDALTKCENNMPDDISEKVIEFEKSSILNPSTDKRGKKISSVELATSTEKLNQELQAKELIFEDQKRA